MKTSYLQIFILPTVSFMVQLGLGEEEIERLEGQGCQVFEPEEQRFDLRKQRVTDMEDNARVNLPKPLVPAEEATIEIRRNAYRKLEEDYKNGKQPSNLTKSQENGLKSLRKRIKDKSIIVMSTDKSKKLAVTSLEDYLKLGKIHTDKDREIAHREIAEREKILNAHSAM